MMWSQRLLLHVRPGHRSHGHGSAAGRFALAGQAEGCCSHAALQRLHPHHQLPAHQLPVALESSLCAILVLRSRAALVNPGSGQDGAAEGAASKLGLSTRAGRTAYCMCTQFALSSLPFPTWTMSPHLANSRMTSCSWLGWKPNTVTHTLSSAGGPARPLRGSQNPDCSLTPLGSGWTVVPGATAGPGMRVHMLAHCAGVLRPARW